MPFSLTEEVTTPPLIELSSDQTPHSPQFKGEQAAKLHLTLGEQSPGMEQVSASVSTGNDQYLKQMLADRQVIRRQQAQADVLQSILQTDPNAVTPELAGIVQGLSLAQLESPDLSDIIESEYAELYTRTASAALGNAVLDDAILQQPEETHELLDRAERHAYKVNMAKKYLDEINSEVAGQSWTGWIGEFIERNIPFVDWYQRQNQVELLHSPILPGDNLEAQYAYLWGLDDKEEFKRQFTSAYEDLKSRNWQGAQAWVEGFFSYGSSDQFLDNAFAVADVAGLAELPAKTLGKALKGVVKGAARSPVAVPEIAKDLGKYSDSATGKLATRISEDGEGVLGTIKNAREVEHSVPSISAPDLVIKNGTGGDQAVYNRLSESARHRAGLAQDFLKTNTPDRLTPEELLRSRDTLLDDYVFRHPEVNKNVIDVEIPRTGDIGNVYTARVLIGHRDGTLFESAAQARKFAEMYLGDLADDLKIERVAQSPVKPVSGPAPINVGKVQPPAKVGGPAPVEIQQIGEGFRIAVTRNIDETKLRDFKLTLDQQTPKGFFREFDSTRALLSPAELLSKQQDLARTVGVSSSEQMASIVTEMARPFGKLTKRELEEMEDIWSFNREKIEFYKDQGELEDAFSQRYGHLPSETQSDSYWAAVQINDLDLMVRDLDWYKQKARMGIEDITVRVDGEDRVFEGKIVDRLPYGSQDYWSVSVVKDGKAEKPRSHRYITEGDKEAFQKLLDEGYKIVQVADMNFKVNVGEKVRRASFLITKDLKRSRVGLKNIDRKPGGHKVHKWPYYVKQAIVGGDDDLVLYSGDRTLFGFRTQKEADDFAKILETAQQKLRDKTPDAVKYARDNLPIPTRQLMKAIKDGEFDLHAPFSAVSSGQRTIDAGALSKLPNVQDLSKNEHNLSAKMTGRFGGERSESNIDLLVSEGNSKFHAEPAPYLSPLDTLREATNDMISKRAFDDYTIMTRENFLREFGDILEGTKEEQLASGLDLLMNPRFKPGVENTRSGDVSRAMNVSRAFNQLKSNGTKIDRQIENFKERLMSSVLPKFGPRGQQWLESYLASKAPNPGMWVRSLAFDLKLGMFNPKQYFIQMNNVVNAVALGGMKGLKGSLSYPLVRSAMWTADPAKIKHLAGLAQKTGLMSADEFEEAVTLYKRSGFNHVGNDAAYLDDMASLELRSSGVGKKVDTVRKAGRKPFQEGERVARISGFMTAYLEKKATKSVLDKRDEAEILRRAKLITGNMSREYNAAWQKGHLAVMTQFMGYQARLMEQMLGKQLTGAEKLRLFAGYSAVYGVPVGLGTAAGVIPVRDVVMEELVANGVDINNPAVEVFTDGFVSQLYEMILGKEVNIADRYGPQGIPTFRDLWRGDKDFVDAILGAGGGIAWEAASSTWGILKAMKSEFWDGEDGLYNLTADDFTDFFRNISSVDDAFRVYQVANFGIWASKNGANITEMDLPDAVMAALTGLQPAEISDSFAANRASKDFKEWQDKEQKEIIKEYRQAMKMDPGKTREMMIRRIKARMIAAGFSPQKARQTWKYAADQEMMVDSFFDNLEEMLRLKGIQNGL